MQKLNFWVPLREPKWHTPICPSIHFPPPSRELARPGNGRHKNNSPKGGTDGELYGRHENNFPKYKELNGRLENNSPKGWTDGRIDS